MIDIKNKTQQEIEDLVKLEVKTLADAEFFKLEKQYRKKWEILQGVWEWRIKTLDDDFEKKVEDFEDSNKKWKASIQWLKELAMSEKKNYSVKLAECNKKSIKLDWLIAWADKRHKIASKKIDEADLKLEDLETEKTTLNEGCEALEKEKGDFELEKSNLEIVSNKIDKKRADLKIEEAEIKTLKKEVKDLKASKAKFVWKSKRLSEKSDDLLEKEKDLKELENQVQKELKEASLIKKENEIERQKLKQEKADFEYLKKQSENEDQEVKAELDSMEEEFNKI